MKKFRKVAVLKGGPSAEREVSLRSGAAVAKGLGEAGYEVSEVDVRGPDFELPPGVEAVFVVLHGEFGEDGAVQRIMEARGIPYTGSAPGASAAAFDKIITKEILVRNGIPTPEYQVLRRGDKRKLELPVVVKPARQGSSIGVYMVFREDQWEEAVAGAFAYDPELIVERYIEGRELTVGVVGSEALPVVEIVPEGGWYDFNSKYVTGKTRYLVPAPVPAETWRKCVDAAMRTFTALGCRGMGRVDLRLAPGGEVYVLELNNIPGFTETSLLPKAAGAAGMSFPQLCDRIMSMAKTGQ